MPLSYHPDPLAVPCREFIIRLYCVLYVPFIVVTFVMVIGEEAFTLVRTYCFPLGIEVSVEVYAKVSIELASAQNVPPAVP